MRKRKLYLQSKRHRQCSWAFFSIVVPHPRPHCCPIIVAVGVFLVPICILSHYSCCSPLAGVVMVGKGVTRVAMVVAHILAHPSPRLCQQWEVCSRPAWHAAVVSVVAA
jgi:hypothetical protein